jgi:hypothetical protein
MAKKLKLSKETLRALAPRDLDRAHGALRDTRTCQYCFPTVYTCSCVNSVCNSCYNTDCCLADTETMCVAP